MSTYIAIKIQKSTKRPIFSTIFFAEKQFFEKITSRGGRQLIVLNPFLDSLVHSGLKNIGLPPGTGSGCFQSSQDVVPIVCDYIDNFSITVDDNIPKIVCSALTFAGQLPHNRFKEICRIRFAILFSRE